MKSSAYEFLSHREEALLSFVLMGLVSFPNIVWVIIFLWAISMVRW